jgi:hypothetical protein
MGIYSFINMKVPKEVNLIASRARWCCEEYARNLQDPYALYTQDINNLPTMCAIASFFLKERLEKAQVGAEVSYGLFASRFPHCWVELVKQDLVVDLTATQFGEYLNRNYKPVHYAKIYSRDYVGGFVIKDTRKFNGWEKNQFPYRKVLNKLHSLYVVKEGHCELRNAVQSESESGY